jgi:hypothetical protein
VSAYAFPKRTCTIPKREILSNADYVVATISAGKQSSGEYCQWVLDDVCQMSSGLVSH